MTTANQWFELDIGLELTIHCQAFYHSKSFHCAGDRLLTVKIRVAGVVFTDTADESVDKFLILLDPQDRVE